MDAPELEALRKALMSGSTDTDVDHARGCTSTAIKMCRRLGVAYATVGGGDAGPYHNPTSAAGVIREQLEARWPVAADQVARTIGECWGQVVECVRAVDFAAPPPDPTPAPPAPPTGWKTLPVLTAAAATSERSSFQSAVPAFTDAGMVVALLAKGDRPGTPNPTKGGATQRCEILLAGWENLTGTQFLRYDFTLGQGFPIATGDWQTIAQLKNDSEGSPPLELMVGKGGRVYLQWHNKAGDETGTEYLGTASTNTRHQVVLKVTFSTTSATAKVSGWYDGAVSFVDVTHGPTLYTGQTSYGKLGLYRSNAIGQAATITHHGVAKAATFAAVT